jgi:hypothetical protein
MYGKKGFLQLQCVIPRDVGRAGVGDLLQRLNEARCASFLAVLKKTGPESGGLLSFPMEGYTLALDIPIRGELMRCLRLTASTGRWSHWQSGARGTRPGVPMNRQHQHNGERR